VLNDGEIKQAQRNKPEQSRALNLALDQLAHALEAVETQKERHGMDKVRAMYGNKQLADSVHDFFLEAVRLLDKQLLILPIDDVDTSLNLAFENLEIIRRYLTTPYVLPIVSGDRALYHEVTWRDFHGRLTRDSQHLSELAYVTALELAEEYQRKVLPFPRRQTMPAASNYWQWSYGRAKAGDKGVTLGNSIDAMPLANFISWMEIFLTGPVNGQESSRLPLPIPSIRALTQLVGHCRDLIPLLPEAIRSAKNELEVRRIWQMPTVPLDAMATFQEKHQKEFSTNNKRDYANAYKVFAEKMKEASPVNYSHGKAMQEDGSTVRVTKIDLTGKLADYFRFESKAGAVYLVLLAKQHWQGWADATSLRRRGSIFDTPLFQPLAHTAANLDLFDKPDDLSAWSRALATRLPEEWLASLKLQKTILPYPLAEVGINASKKWNYAKDISTLTLSGLDVRKKSRATFLISLLAQRNFYTNAKQTMLLNIGRIFELIIASIAGPVSQEDLHAILVGAPFFSTRALAPTKTLLDKPEDEGKAVNVATPNDSGGEFALIAELQDQIDAWRRVYHLDQIDLSPWLVYKVFNKVYSQVASSEKSPTGMTHVGTALDMVAHTFYATWFAFGSFEKGELFGLPNVVATTNLNPENLKNFESNDHFTINVGPFAPTSSQILSQDSEPYQNKSTFGKHSGTISYCLAQHPLKTWIDELIKLDWPEPNQAGKDSKAGDKQTAIQWLCDKLEIKVPKALRMLTIQKALDGWDSEKSLKLLNEMQEIYPRESALATFERAIKLKFSV
jgi:hypothetical protein